VATWDSADLTQARFHEVYEALFSAKGLSAPWPSARREGCPTIRACGYSVWGSNLPGLPRALPSTRGATQRRATAKRCHAGGTFPAARATGQEEVTWPTLSVGERNHGPVAKCLPNNVVSVSPMVRSFIPLLFAAGSPAAITRGIPATVVDAVEGVVGARTGSQTVRKCGEVVPPFRADGDTPAAVKTEVPVLGSFAPVDHRSPSAVFGRVPAAVFIHGGNIPTGAIPANRRMAG